MGGGFLMGGYVYVVGLGWLWYGWWVFGGWLGLCGGFLVVCWVCGGCGMGGGFMAMSCGD